MNGANNPDRTVVFRVSLAPGSEEYRIQALREHIEGSGNVHAVEQVPPERLPDLAARLRPDEDDQIRTDGSGIPLAGDPPDEDATIDDLDDTLVADPESGTRYVVTVRSGELTLFAGGDPREGVAHETPASLYRKYQNGEYYGPDPDRSPWPVLERLVGAGEVFGGP